MKLEKILKLDELKDFLNQNQITVQKSNIGIKLVTKNNVTVTIHRQSHILPEQEPLIYLDCCLSSYGLRDFRRNWHENENLSDYLVKIVIPYIVDLAGPFTISENDVEDLIIKNLNRHGIEIDEKKRSDLKYIEFDSMGEEIETFRTNKPLIVFHVKETKYAIDYHKSFNELLIFKNYEENEVLMSYPWHSFCSSFLLGEEYVKAEIEGIVNFINNR